MSIGSLSRKGLALPLLLLAAACTDSPFTPPAQPTPEESLAKIRCDVSVVAQTVSCQELAPITVGGARALVYGGQDVYVKIATSGASYDSGTQIYQMSVTVQNLLGNPIGTTDGVNPAAAGVRVFLQTGPTVTGGTGAISVNNADGTAMFTSPGQPYFQYNGILDPNEISSSKVWLFNVQNTISTFSFVLAVSADRSTDPFGSLWDKVWEGTVSTVWSLATNWRDDALPTTTSAVTVPIPSQMVGANMPVLTAGDTIKHLRVGTGSTLGLGTFTLQVDGNADAPGVVSNGTVRMTGAGALLKGFVPALEITGSTFLQGSTRTTGAVNVTGTLTTNGNALTIAVP